MKERKVKHHIYDCHTYDLFEKYVLSNVNEVDYEGGRIHA